MMKKLSVSIMTGIAILFFTTFVYADSGIIGLAVYDDLGQYGTTGGGDGTIVRVTTRADLETYADASGPYTILVEGSFAGSGMIEVASDKSIIGVGSGATFDGIGINVSGKRNIIIRKIKFCICHNVSYDSLFLKSCTYWVKFFSTASSNLGIT